MIALVAVVFVYVVGCLLAHWFEDASYRDPFARTLDEIRSLPETPEAPYDWDRERAA